MMKGLLKFVIAAAVMAVCSVSVKAQDAGNPEYVIVAAKLPTIDGVGVQVIGGSKFTSELLVTGYWFTELEATGKDSISFVGHDNASGKDYVFAEYDAQSSAWIEYAVELGKEWLDDSWKGVPCKWVEFDLSDAQKYAWKLSTEVLPAKVNSVSIVEQKKAVKVMENGMIYIVKDGVKYNLLGIAQ